MNNPLNSIALLNPSVPEGTFRRGFAKGAGSGALMMSLFTGVLYLSTFIPGNPLQFHFAIVAATSVIGSITTGLFTGITSTQRAAEAHSSARLASHDAQRTRIRAPEQSAAPAVEHAAHNSREWQTRVEKTQGSSHDRVSKILADGKLSDGDRAASILRDREQSNTLNASR